MPSARQIANSFSGVATWVTVLIVSALLVFGGVMTYKALEPVFEVVPTGDTQPEVEVDVFTTGPRMQPSTSTPTTRSTTTTQPSTSTSVPTTDPRTLGIPSPSAPALPTAPPMPTVPPSTPTPPTTLLEVPDVLEVPVPTLPEATIPPLTIPPTTVPEVTVPPVTVPPTTTTSLGVAGEPGRPCPAEGIAATFHNGLLLICVSRPVVGLIWLPV